ncbi:MAG: hypothetical protein WC752_04315 [Patescibacteria group bacterium]|jgi:hypothetical protein
MKNKKIFLIIGIVLLVLASAMLAIKGLSKEDDWICSNGQWVQHGHPSAPMPTEACTR